MADSFAGGDGTESSPYEIANGEQLARLAWCLRLERTFEEQVEFYYEQHMEKALLINHRGTVASFAAYARNARVENCQRDTTFWLDGEESAAGLLGSATGCYVADCTFTGIMDGENNQHNCYGITGDFSGYMENCRNEADITTGGYYAGGITGCLDGNVVFNTGVIDRHGNTAGILCNGD